MKSLLVALLALMSVSVAHAQTTANQVVAGYNVVCTNGQGVCFVPTGAGGQAQVRGFATLATSNTSTLVSTATAGPNSAVWPTNPGQVTFFNSGATVDYICPLGGVCTVSNGIPIAAGTSLTLLNPSNATTVINGSTGSLVVMF